MSWKIRQQSFSTKFYNETVHEDPLLDKDGLPSPIFMFVKKTIKSIILCK
jgi:hypothetical protein